MLVKEAGYDEFVAEQIALAEADIKAGRVYSQQEVNDSILNLLEKKAKELELAEQEQREELVYA